MDPMQKMWASFVAIGLMALSAFIITFARSKTRGIIRVVLSLIAFVTLFVAMLLGIISIL
ncbi:DUF2768 family protein [Xylanibacillus composti]|uniref:DUF2768 family protein n=1 Tax=Xylanibacillus composti TaxID=1572762 RepID=A0A8J4H4X8_9BACL|nr:DUF2768 family protein [Xylanibacillus composti]MDT9725446.1 DUF2768 family protein [Xylanibacillus composti]GIQ71038.1 hypothetical protein XYCOK13_38620 [Xylanibacillus composti]